MMLLTKALKDKLIENSNVNRALNAKNKDTIDFKPVIKFFMPSGGATWLFTEYDPDNNELFGLCDLGMGEPELGYVSFEEISRVKGSFGLGVERDMSFVANKTLSEYAKEARELQRINA